MGQIMAFNREYAKHPRNCNARLPNKGSPGYEKALEHQYLEILSKMHRIKYEFFTGNKYIDFKSLYQQYQTLTRDNKNCENNNTDRIRALSLDKVLPPLNVNNEDFDCLKGSFRSFRQIKKTVMVRRWEGNWSNLKPSSLAWSTNCLKCERTSAQVRRIRSSMSCFPKRSPAANSDASVVVSTEVSLLGRAGDTETVWGDGCEDYRALLGEEFFNMGWYYFDDIDDGIWNDSSYIEG